MTARLLALASAAVTAATVAVYVSDARRHAEGGTANWIVVNLAATIVCCYFAALARSPRRCVPPPR